MVPGLLHHPGRRVLPLEGREGGRRAPAERVHQPRGTGARGHAVHLARRADQLHEDRLREGDHLSLYIPSDPAPEELKDISYGKLEESANFALNESFSIGLTCLDAATLTDASAFYEVNNKFKYDKLEERLAQLQQNDSYSAPLVLLIKGLCQAEPTKRISCKELVEWLAPYENSIVELAEFTVSEVPEKLHRLQEKPQAPKPQPLQYQSNQPPISYVSPSYLSGPVNPPPQVVRQVYQNFPNEHFSNQTYLNGNQQNLPRPLTYEPQPVLFQSEPNQRVTYAENPISTQVRGANINFQQIDEQLQMSRKLFPS